MLERRLRVAGVFALSVQPGIYQGNFLKDLFWGTFYGQHLGEEYCGLSTARKGETIRAQTHHGLLRPSFSRNLYELGGTDGIGYCGSDREPFLVDSKMGEWSACFTGNLINRQELVNRFMNNGHIFEKRAPEIADIEIIAKLIGQGDGIIDGIKKMAEEINGAFVLVILTKEGIYAARGPTGHWPLVIGEKQGAVAVASETVGFSNFGFKRIRDLKPGEIVLLRNGKWETKGMIRAERIQFCSFVWVYTAFPTDMFEGIPASLVRKRLGAALARRDIERGFIPDIVAPIPDSGRFHAIGYKQAFDLALMKGEVDRVPFYDEVLLKYPYVGRSYIPQSHEARVTEAHIKLIPSGEDFSNKKIVICDDSIVRGTQIKTNLVPKLESIGIRQVHFRISNPPLFSHCPWGKTTRKGETLASRMPSINERIAFLGNEKDPKKNIVKSLEYNTIEDLVQAIGLPREQLCVDCDLPHRD